MSPPPPLVMERAVKRFRRGLFGPVERAVDEVDLQVGSGEVVALIGESGSGKTTLARLAVGLLGAEGGEVRIFGERVGDLRGAALRALRRRAQLLFQSPDAHLNPGLPLLAQVEESARLFRAGADPRAEAEAALGQVGLLHRAEALPGQLSGGERRRAGIARVLLARPELILADEPTAGLDAALKADIIDLLLAGRRPDTGVLLISHDLPVVRYAASRVVVLLAGQVVEQLPIEALGRGPHHPFTWALLDASGLIPRRAAPPAAEQPAHDGGCRHAEVCPAATSPCRQHAPALARVGEGRAIRCHLGGTP